MVKLIGLNQKTILSYHNIFTATKGDFGREVEKVSVNYADHSYTISTLNNKINIVKRTTTDLYH